MYIKCIPHFNKLLYTFSIQNLAVIVLLILYPKCIQKFDKMRDTFCLNFVYISCVLNTQTFTSQQTKRTFNIFHKLTWKSQYVIYLMECILRKIQYVGKSKTPFYWRLNNHRKDVNNPKSIPVCNHFKIHGHNFMKHAKYTLIEQLMEMSNVSKDTIRLRLKWRENFWIIKLKNTCSQGTKPRTKQCLMSNNCIFSSFNSHLAQWGRKRCHYDIPPNIWCQIKIFCNHLCFSNKEKFPWKQPRPKLVGKQTRHYQPHIHCTS